MWITAEIILFRPQRRDVAYKVSTGFLISHKVVHLPENSCNESFANRPNT
ncbi:hypothetical protein Cylst_2143 [Cylindrospermum stagnale PCC 7417]|uniref:Uncharacterized protein n=1 Tax=Cylindrospermum stagnale PCC 7417 TaxID=56107 RepID=K9WVH0_9NOST|nr:hypothetical protein Cylst_2143 [Cylindrospermum stagnale PCC 7417]